MANERPFIEHLTLAGYKSIRQADIDFTRVNVLIGSNGAGKSNLVSFFAMLNASLNGKLDEYVGRNGGPNALLHLGAKQTSEIATVLTFHTEAGRGEFYQRLGFRAPDRLYYEGDYAASLENASDSVRLPSLDGFLDPQYFIYNLLTKKYAAYHLIDTSLTSALRREAYIQDNQLLRPDGGNLAAILHLYKSMHRQIYDRIRSAVRKVAPAFDDFVLEPQRFNPNNILLNWRQAGSDYLLGPHQISDGMLRGMALITILLQPTADLPDLLILDEPELGLHPMAMSMVAGLIRAVSVTSQVIVTTQSAAFLDQFDASEIIVVDSDKEGSHFRRLDPSDLKDWLEDYSLGELWEKNVIGGGPMP